MRARLAAWVGALTAILAISGGVSAAVDAPAAEALAKRSGCLKCHAVDRSKDGPAFKEVAAKYKSQPDAERKLVVFLTSNPKIKVDGREETHDALKTKSEADVHNVVGWILSR
jgi:cytochrome c